MLCERCKIREANIQYTEVIQGVRTEHHFCTQCAKELDFGHYSAIFDGEFPLGKLLSSLLGTEGTAPKQEKHSQVVCPVCGTSYEDFVSDSCFGCADCYGVFDLLIHDNITQLQGSSSHKGKKPGNQETVSTILKEGEMESESLSRDEEIEILELRLKEALKQEDYETAAKCRDRLRVLREGNKDNE